VKTAHSGSSWLRRSRLYVICVLRTALKVVHDIPELYATVSRAVGEPCGASVADLSLATRQELHDEENLQRVSHGLRPISELSRDWSYLLSHAERRLAQTLRAQWQTKHHRNPDEDLECVFDLSKSPSRSRCSATRGVLPTITRVNAPRFWLPARKRWLLRRELAAAMGYPVYSQLARAGRVSEDSSTSPPGDSSRMIGNAMHVASVGCVLAVALAATEPR
jgi:hypothetical protein